MDINYRAADIFVQDIFAGILRETDEGYMFSYDKDYLNSDSACAISITMPLQEEPYISPVLFPFFDGLIPEGWLYDVVKKNWKLSSSDRFGALLVTGMDPIGDVRIQERRED